MKMFTWVVEFQVSDNWVEDGFDLTNERAKSMIENDLQWAYGHETRAKVLSAPNPQEIRKVQGYED